MVLGALNTTGISTGQLFSRNWAEPQFGGGLQEDESLQITPAPTAFYRIDGLERDSQAAQLARDSGYYQASGNTRQGAHGHDDENDNTAEGQARRTQSIIKRSEAFGGGSWFQQPYEPPRNYIDSAFQGVRHAISDLQERPLEATANIGESALHTLTGGLAGFFGIRSREQIAEDIRATGEIDGRTDRGPSGADRLGSDFSQDAGATMSNVGESALNMVTFGMVGRSREQIAAEQAEHGTVDGRQPAVAAQSPTNAPTPPSEPLIAHNDVVSQQNFQNAPDMFNQFASAVSGAFRNIDLNPFDGQQPVHNQQFAAADPGMRLG